MKLGGNGWTLARNSWNWLKMNDVDGNVWNGCKWLKLAGIAYNGWNWLEIAGNGWKWMEMAGKWLEMTGNAWNGWTGMAKKRLKMTKNSWNCVKISCIARNGWNCWTCWKWLEMSEESNRIALLLHWLCLVLIFMIWKKNQICVKYDLISH